MHGPEIHQGDPAGSGPGPASPANLLPAQAGLQACDPDPGRPGGWPRAAGAIWLLSGIGEGPLLARALLARGWRLRVSVVSEVAARAYPAHPRLELQVGALAGAEAIAAALVAERRQGGFRWVVDGTHPFAERISADLLAACRRLDQPLLRLQRSGPDLQAVAPVSTSALTRMPVQEACQPGDATARPASASGPASRSVPSTAHGQAPIPGPTGPARHQLLASLEELASIDLGGKRLLLAIGARRLGQALACTPGAIPFARILPNPTSLALARSAGLADHHLACLHPAQAATAHGVGAIERALCRQWDIDVVLCRQSGGVTEQLWGELCADLGLELLLLRQPQAGDRAPGMAFSALLEALGHPGSNALA